MLQIMVHFCDQSTFIIEIAILSIHKLLRLVAWQQFIDPDLRNHSLFGIFAYHHYSIFSLF
jgi:hypothetical protein